MRQQGVIRCPSCGLWSAYSTGRNMVDRKCLKCGKRTRVMIERKGLGGSSTLHSQGRGRPRVTEIRELPIYMPQEAAQKFLVNLNRWERRGRRQSWQKQGGSDKFVQASKITRPGTKQYRKKIREMPEEEWDRIESLDDFLAEEWGGKKNGKI